MLILDNTVGEIIEMVGSLNGSVDEECVIRDAFHVIFNTCRPPYGGMEQDKFGQLCDVFVRMKTEQLAKCEKSRDEYGNLVFFLDEFISSADYVMRKSGVEISFSCSQEDIFCQCCLEHIYYVCSSIIRSAVNNGGKHIALRLIKVCDSVCIIFTCDGMWSDEARMYADRFASVYDGTILTSKGGDAFQLSVKISPDCEPGDNIALYDTDFIYDCMSPVYIGLGVMMR